VSGRFTKEQRAIYDLVYQAQEAGIQATRAGAAYLDPHWAAEEVLANGMAELGLIRDAADRNGLRRFFMHATSHYLGLDVHDVGNYGADGHHRALESGMVFTVEPGIYLAADDEDVPAEFRGIGVRIEDDIAITEDGCENLTESIATDPEDVEALVADR